MIMKTAMPGGQGHGVGKEGVEFRGDRGRVLAGETTASVLEDVGHGPARYYAVVGCDQVGRQHAGPADQGPVFGTFLAAGHVSHRVGRALPAPAAQHDFGDQDWQGHENNRKQVNQDKGAAAILPGDVREFPDIAEPDGGANGGHQEGETGGPFFVLGVDGSHRCL